MLNRMCNQCSRLNKDCNGTENQTWTGCVRRTTTLDEQKKQAKSDYHNARIAYLDNPTPDAWKILCDAKSACRLLGCII